MKSRLLVGTGMLLADLDWRYKKDADGFQVYIAGDHFDQLHAFLTAAFGPPARPPTTNETAGTRSIGTFYSSHSMRLWPRALRSVDLVPWIS